MAFPILGNPYPEFTDVNGNPYASGTLEFRKPADNSNAYSYPTADDADAQTNPNGTDLTLNQRGTTSVGVWGEDGVTYKVTLKDSSGATVWTSTDIGWALTSDMVDDALSTTGVGVALYPRTAAETAAGIAAYVAGNAMGEIVQPQYPPGRIERYGVNTTPGTTNMAAALTAAGGQALQSGGAPVTGYGSYNLTSVVNLRMAAVELEHATINIGHAGIGLIIGGNSASTLSPTQRIGFVSRSVGAASATTPDVRIMGSKNQIMHINSCEYVQLWADSDTGADKGQSGSMTSSSMLYSTLYYTGGIGGEDNTLHLAGNESTDTPGTAEPINECHFYLKRVKKILSTGPYDHNHNHFYGGNLEDSAMEVNFTVGRSNWFHDLRLESSDGAGVIEFGATTMANVFLQSWNSSGGSLENETFRPATVTDEGQGNIIGREISALRHTSIVGKVTASDPVFDTDVLYSSRTPHIGVIRTDNDTATILDTDYIRVRKNDIVGFFAEWNETEFADTDVKYELNVYTFDENKKPIAVVEDTDWISSGDAFASNTGPFRIVSTSGTNSKHLMFCTKGLTDTDIWPGTVAFVKLRLLASDTNGDAQGASQINLYVRRASSYDKPHETAVPDMGIYPKSGMHVVTAVPTQGYAPLGYMCLLNTGLEYYQCIRSVDTRLTSNANSTSTITVDDATGVVAGDIVGILNDDNLVTDWRTVNSAAGTPTLTLTGGATSGNCSAGNRVVFIKWQANA